MSQEIDQTQKVSKWFHRKTIKDIEVYGKVVLVRVDFNVPFRPGTLEISDDSRIRSALDTIRYLMNHHCKIVLCSHLGRPKGKIVEELRMAPVIERLSELLGMPVVAAMDCVGEEVRKTIVSLKPGDVLMLENLRFHVEEEDNAESFAMELASLADVFVDDAFGVSHRSHASTEGVSRFLPSVAGFLMAREVDMLGQLLDSPSRPLVSILGGAKVSDKIGVLKNLWTNVDVILIGGGMAATFLKAKGMEVGESIVDLQWLDFAAEFTKSMNSKGVPLELPIDVVVADSFSKNARRKTVDSGSIPYGWRIMDIGPKTEDLFQDLLLPARTVVWNGPMGVFEWMPFSHGTVSIARTLASMSGVTTIIGGGSTAEAVDTLDLSRNMTHVSTGGGAALEFLEGKELPGIVALMPN